MSGNEKITVELLHGPLDGAIISVPADSIEAHCVSNHSAPNITYTYVQEPDEVRKEIEEITSQPRAVKFIYKETVIKHEG